MFVNLNETSKNPEIFCLSVLMFSYVPTKYPSKYEESNSILRIYFNSIE